MTSLVEIIRQMTNADGRATRELPRGLWLVYYPPAGEEPPRLIAARHLSTPSTTELQVVRDALLTALDTHPSLVIGEVDADWTPTAQGDWEGYQIAWRTLSTAGAFSRDADLRQRVRLALEQREQRELKRRQKQHGQKTGPAANPGPIEAGLTDLPNINGILHVPNDLPLVYADDAEAREYLKWERSQMADALRRAGLTDQADRLLAQPATED